MKQSEKIIKRSENFAKWYTSVIKVSNIVDYGLIKGTIILKPYGFDIWENIRKTIDIIFKDENIQNCALPTLIPYSEFIKEKTHIKGFAPELFKITNLENEELDDPYVLRPTSEISFCHFFKNNIHNYNDLPLKLNQWCNVFRVEKNTKPFLRTSEFFWQEQHSAFETPFESNCFAKKIAILYKNFLKEYLAIPSIMGEKTESEKFAGALTTHTIETMMQDGQALQSATSHDLGTIFSIPFNIKYQDKNNKYQNINQTSAGISSRIIGGIIMIHGDDKGLVLPPKIAPIQIKINALFHIKNPHVLEICKNLKKTINTTRVFIDSTNKNIGFKMFDGETKGIPIQINIGPKSVENNQAEIIIRNKLEKIIIDIDKIDLKLIKNMLTNYHDELYKKAENFFESRIIKIKHIDELEPAIKSGNFIIGFWAGSSKDEEEIKKNTGATSRCLVESNEIGRCFYTGKESKIKAYFGRAY